MRPGRPNTDLHSSRRIRYDRARHALNARAPKRRPIRSQFASRGPLEQPNGHQTLELAAVEKKQRTLLEAIDVTLTYTTGGVVTNAVDNVSLRIAPGEFIGLVGPSGSGKSSLLYLLAGLKVPTSGWVFFNLQELSGLPGDARAGLRQRHFGFIFQQHFLIQYLTALENVLVSIPKPSRADRERALALLDKLGLADHARKVPHQLSGGQRQRVAAARSIMHRPDVIFADEPTASLDHQTAFELMSVIQQIRREEQSTLVVVTHDPSILDDADRVVRMWDGRIQDESSGPDPVVETQELAQISEG